MEIMGIIRARLSEPDKLSCLDIGASPFTLLLRGYFGKVTALDLSFALQKRFEDAGIELHGGGVEALGEGAHLGPTDCVTCLEVIEHLHTDPVVLLQRIRAALRPGGLLVLSTPNLMCLANRVLMLGNRKLHHFTYPPFSLNDQAHGYGHDRIYMPAELSDYFQAAGFEAVETLYQLHFSNAEATQPSKSLSRKLVAILKRGFPSLRDGIIVLGRNPVSNPAGSGKS
jgi:2-polyprenyl-3-methyl-5-hydroxy-6-metoxy-1,4-benzoquinol methylase